MKRLLALAEKTGDKVIVTDPAGETPYVLMTLDQYEALIGSEAPKVPGTAAVPGTSEKSAEPKKIVLAAGKFRMPLQDADLGVGAGLLKPQRSNLKPQTSAWTPQFQRKQPEKVAAKAEDAVLDPEGEERFFLEPLE